MASRGSKFSMKALRLLAFKLKGFSLHKNDYRPGITLFQGEKVVITTFFPG
jgi:hypothetical protein